MPSAPSALAMTRISPFVEYLARELLTVGNDFVAVAGHEAGKRLVTAAGGMKVVVRLVEENPRTLHSGGISRVRHLRLKSGISLLASTTAADAQRLGHRADIAIAIRPDQASAALTDQTAFRST